MAATVRRRTIGVLAGWQFYWTATPLSYLEPIYRGIQLGAQLHGCNLLLGCGMGQSATAQDPMRPAWPLAAADSDFVPIGPWNTDGLIAVNPLHSRARSHYLQELRASGHPVVFIGSGEPGPAIVADNEGGIRAAVRHLVEHGHRHIAFIAGSPEDLEGDSGARLRAYLAAQAAFELPADERLVAFGRHIYTGGQAAMGQLLENGVPFTAVLASNDESALGAMQVLVAAGRRIPEDVALIGFDDRPESAVQTPPLSSVHIPLFQMGFQAVALLLRQCEEGPHPAAARVVVGARLVRRSSCGCRPDGLRGEQEKERASAVQEGQMAEDALPAQAMAAAVLATAQKMSGDEVEALCRRLAAAFAADLRQPGGEAFSRTLEEALRRSAEEGDDAHIWQAALTRLPQGPAAGAWAGQTRAAAMLDDARVAISAAMWRQHRQYVVTERWTINRLGLLTAQLLTALEEAQIFQVLAEQLPGMEIHQAWLALFVPQAETAEWSTLRAIVPPGGGETSFRHRDFPPPALVPAGQPFSLALLPLVSPRGQVGYVVFEATQLLLFGAIVQQMAAALNTAHLYAEAMEGRRLAEAANLMKSRFLSTVSHELRTPLNVIVGTSGLLLQESEQARTALPARHDDVRRLHASARHLSGLIGDVLDLASSEAGQLRLASGPVDLAQAMRMVAEIGRQLAAEKGLAWQADLPAQGPWVWGDRTRLRQVALNLVSNAVKFTAHGRVSLALTGDGAWVQVRVQDTGIGIAPAEQPLIFDEFRRTERSIAGRYGGLGLGLAIARRLVELHGGALQVESTGREGEGSTFTFTLPTAPAPAQAEGQPLLPESAADLPLWPAGAVERPARVVVVVDDDPETLEMHARIVQAHAPGNHVLRARNGREALALLRQAPVELVVLDLMMPGLDGFGVLEAMRGDKALRDIPVVVVTGQTLTEAEMARLNEGVATVLTKGLYSFDETLAHLDAALQHRRKLNNETRRLVRAAMAFLHEHYAMPLARADIARHVGLDEDYLTLCFRQELGVTPMAYLNRYRVNQARRLLRETDENVTAIAQEVGFADSGYFSRIFRREVGMSPQAYRRA